MKRVIYILLSVFLLSGCLEDESIKLKIKNTTPSLENDSWEVDANYVLNSDQGAWDEIVNTVYSEDKYLFIKSLVVAKKGKLVFECYPQDVKDKVTPHQIWSMTKSFISVLTGIALDQQYIHSVKDSVFCYLPEFKTYASKEKLGITIENCLTMRSGIDYDNDGWEEEELLAQVPSDLTKYIIQRPSTSLPGTNTVYKNSDPQLLVKVIANALHKDLITYADENLFQPLGIENYYWSRNKDQTPFGGNGLWLTPRDLTKFGQLLLNKGLWKGQQIISSEWVNESTTVKTIADGYGYGYFFWVDSQKKYFWCWGHAGQYIFVVPNKEMVITITSEQFADEGGTTITEAIELVDRIIACDK